MTDKPKTSEQPSGHLRWVEREEYHPEPRLGPNVGHVVMGRVLQQKWYLTEYHGAEVEPEQTEVWRDVPMVSEP